MNYTRMNEPPLALNPAILEGGEQPMQIPGPYPPGPFQDEEGHKKPWKYSQPMEDFPLAPITHQPKSEMSYQPADSKQPGGDGNWMPIPTGIPPVCPPGLEFLTSIDELVFNKKVEQTEGCGIKNTYTIKNGFGQRIYTTVEGAECCTLFCCGTGRPFEMEIKDHDGNEVIHLVRELACDSCCCPCCLQKLEVMSPAGVPCGRVVQEWGILSTKYRVENESGETVLKIKESSYAFGNNEEGGLEVFSTDGKKVGKITKKRLSRLSREAHQYSDYLGITFPVNLDVKVKATLLGAVFLIGHMFYAKNVHEGDKFTECCECFEICCYCLACLCRGLEVVLR